ncbi:MAG: hypothetical protein JOZ99_00425 [Actinobacteria bacterium]|nr:hypothetical protein [Actinomycetota bacterium]
MRARHGRGAEDADPDDEGDTGAPSDTAATMGDARGGTDNPLWAHPLLVVLTVGAAALEAGILVLVAPHSARGLAPQVVAPAPFGVFHDLRWLLVYHRSWLALAVELVALLAFRATVDALLLRAAWPRGLTPPRFTTSFARVLGFTVVALLALVPWTFLLFALAIIPISWLFFAAIPPAIATVVIVHHGAARAGWWRAMPPLRTSGWMLATFGVLTLGSAAITLSPVWPFAVLSAAATGLFDAWAWCRIVEGVQSSAVGETLRTRPVRRWIPVAPIALASIFAIVIGGSAIGFAVHERTQPALTGSPAPLGTGDPVLVVSGFASQWDGTPVDILGSQYRQWRFSYRGLGPNGQPLSYGSRDTQQSLAQLDRLMSNEVDAIHTLTQRPVAIVAESEGALVAKTYLLATPDPPVQRLVLLSPLVRPGRVYYPSENDDGWGIFTGWGLRGVSKILTGLSQLELSPDSPFIQDVDRHGAALRDALSCGQPGVQQDAFVPLADAVTGPFDDNVDLRNPNDMGPVRVWVVPAFHGGLLASHSIQQAIAAVLQGRDPRVASWAEAASVIRSAAAAWQVPDLPVNLNPVWKGTMSAGLSSTVRASRCAAVRSELRAMVSGS